MCSEIPARKVGPLVNKATPKSYWLRGVVLSILLFQSPHTLVAASLTLSDEISQVRLEKSMDAFRVGGATMDDAVHLLREQTSLSIGFESLDYDRATRDKLTLGDVLDAFRNAKASYGLTAEDEARFKIYEAMAADQSLATTIGVKTK